MEEEAEQAEELPVVSEGPQSLPASLHGGDDRLLLFAGYKLQCGHILLNSRLNNLKISMVKFGTVNPFDDGT